MRLVRGEGCDEGCGQGCGSETHVRSLSRGDPDAVAGLDVVGGDGGLDAGVVDLGEGLEESATLVNHGMTLSKRG